MSDYITNNRSNPGDATYICNRCYKAFAKYIVGKGEKKEGFCEDCLKGYI